MKARYIVLYRGRTFHAESINAVVEFLDCAATASIALGCNSGIENVVFWDVNALQSRITLMRTSPESDPSTSLDSDEDNIPPSAHEGDWGLYDIEPE